MKQEKNKNYGHVIDCKNLTKVFDDFVAVDHINIGVKQGEIFGFLGPNGAGKSTTIRMLCGILTPSDGSGHVLGCDIVKESERIKEKIGYMSQRFNLYDDLTVNENLDFYGKVYLLPKNKLKERKEFVLEMAGLQGKERELTKNLSGAWKQRLALGCAIIHEPEVVFLDEPTAGVDPISRRSFWDFLYQLSEQGTTFLVTTHYMDEAEHCHRIGFIFDGKIIARGTPDELKDKQMQGQVMEVECDHIDVAIDILEQLPVLDEVAMYGSLLHIVSKRTEEAKLKVASALKEHGIVLHRIEKITPSIEDVFVSLVAPHKRKMLKEVLGEN